MRLVHCKAYLYHTIGPETPKTHNMLGTGLPDTQDPDCQDAPGWTRTGDGIGWHPRISRRGESGRPGQGRPLPSHPDRHRAAAGTYARRQPRDHLSRSDFRILDVMPATLITIQESPGADVTAGNSEIFVPSGVTSASAIGHLPSVYWSGARLELTRPRAAF